MGVFKMTLLTVGAVGAAMMHYGRDTDLPADKIGREPTIAQDTIVTVSATQEAPVAVAVVPAVAVVTEPVAESEPVQTAAVATDTPASRAEEAARQMAAGTLVVIEDVPADVTGLPRLVVKASAVNMRGGPSTDYGIVGRLTRGTAVVEVAKLESGWSQIRVEETGKLGFMANKFLAPGQ